MALLGYYSINKQEFEQMRTFKITGVSSKLQQMGSNLNPTGFEEFLYSFLVPVDAALNEIKSYNSWFVKWRP